jgi:hypothetical protein
MLLNPCKTKISTIEGTRVLEDGFGLIGFQYVEPKNPQRIWTLQHLLAPLPRRALRGIRAKFTDEKGFVSFCNQRDLEVLLGLGKPGDFCHWFNGFYPEVGDRNWFGLCADQEDLADDLQERELRLREQYPEVLPSDLEIVRRIHDGTKDTEELIVLLWDMDPETGYSPDARLETIEKRWAKVERTPVNWELVDL